MIQKLWRSSPDCGKLGRIYFLVSGFWRAPINDIALPEFIPNRPPRNP
jgi:hypothetical protein